MRAWIKNPNHIFRAAVVIAVGLTTTHLALSFALTSAPFLKAVLNDLLLVIASGVATVSLFYAAHRSALSGRRIHGAWIILALAHLFYTVANITWLALEITRNETTFSAADIFYLLAFPLFALGIVLLPEDSRTLGEQLKIALDTGIVMMAAGLLFWIFVLAPIIIANQGSDFLTTLLALAYPILDLTLSFVLLRLFWGRFGASFQMPLFLLLLSGVFQIATDTLVSIQSVQGSYQSGNWVDTGYMLSCVMIGFAGIMQASEVKSGHTTPVRGRAPRYGWFTWTFYIPFLGVIVAYGLVVWNVERALPIPPHVLAGIVASIIGLLLLRRAITIMENRQLYTAAQREIAERKHAEESLRQLNEKLEARVKEHTIELQQTNTNLRSEITERARVEDRQRVVYQLLNVVSGQLDSTAIAQMAVETIVKLTAYPHVCLALPSPDGQHWVVCGAGGSLAAELGTIYSIHQGVIGRVFKTGQSQWIHDVLDDPSYVRDVNRADAPALRSEVAASIRRGEHLLGVLNIESDRVDAFLEEDVLMIQSLGDVIALALENARLFEEAQREIAERKHTEEVLGESEAKLRQIASTLHEVFWLRDTQTLEILYVNPAYETVWGRPCTSLYENPTSFVDAVHPDDKERVMRAIAVQRETGTSFNEEYRIIRPDDSVRWVWGQTFPIKNEAGQVYRIAASVVDITERKRADEELRASEERWRSLVENAPAIIVTLDRDGTILSMNRTASGQSAEPFIGKNLFDFLPPTECTQTREVLELVFHFGQPTQYETTITAVGDKTMWFSNHIAPIKRESQVKSVIIVAIDITERKQMEEQLRHLSTHDALTGLYNRAFFESELNRLRTSRQFPISIVVVDIDGMKIANDTLGHAA
ncbi:partial putative diguanylate cyclase DgcE, partial [Methylococcales bacterium]